MRQSSMPAIAGIIEIVAGVISTVGGIVMIILSNVMDTIPDFPDIAPAVMLAIGIPALLLGGLELAGGIYAMWRKMWKLAFAGAIAALFTTWLLGIPAVFLLVFSKHEFE